VSKASEDLPDPDRPVMTTSWLRGRSTSMFLRLWVRAPRTRIIGGSSPTRPSAWPRYRPGPGSACGAALGSDGAGTAGGTFVDMGPDTAGGELAM